MNTFKKIIQTTILFLLIPIFSHAAGGKAYPSNQTETAQPIAAINSSGNQVVVHADASGNLYTVSSSGTIDSISNISLGTDVSSLGKNANASWSSSSIGVSSLHVRSDGTTSICSTNNRYCPPTVNAAGAQFVTLSTALAGEDQLNNTMAQTRKFVASSVYPLSVDKSSALEASSVSKVTAGIMCAASGRIDSSAPSGTYYLQFIDSSSVPPDGAVTLLRGAKKFVHNSGTDTFFDIDMTTVNCIYGASGLVTVLSTTEFSKTISGAYLSMTEWYL